MRGIEEGEHNQKILYKNKEFLLKEKNKVKLAVKLKESKEEFIEECRGRKLKRMG